MKNVSLPYTTYIPWIVLSTSLKKKAFSSKSNPRHPQETGCGKCKDLPRKKTSTKVTLMMKGFASAEEDIKDEVLQRPLSIHQLSANYTKHLVKKYLADVSNKEAKHVPYIEG